MVFSLRTDVAQKCCHISILALVYLLTTGCATIVKGTTQEIPINSDPPGADILVNGMVVGTTPADIEMKRKRDHLITIQKRDYHPKSVAVVKNVGGAVWGNIIAGGLIGWGVDATSGAQNNLSPETIYVRLDPMQPGDRTTDSPQDSSIGIRKLNELDQLKENKQISDEEYARARIALIEKYFPEMVPQNDQSESAETAPD